MLPLLLLLMFQEHQIRFSPITAGNTISMGSFLFQIPEATLMATGENIPLMYKAARVKEIPSCSGILFSTDGQLKFLAVFQSVQEKQFVFEPTLDAAALINTFSKEHLYDGTAVEGPVETVLQPRIDLEARTFEMGLSYQSKPGQDSVFFKKIWLADNNALLLTIKVHSFDDYLTYEEVISRVMASIQPKPEGLSKPTSGQPISYLALLGREVAPPTIDMEKAMRDYKPKLPKVVIYISISLVIFAFVLLAVAYKFRKTGKADPDSCADSFSDQETEEP